MGFDPRKYKPYPKIAKTDRRWPSRQLSQAPSWCSVDLRDGNQALVNPMSVSQKQRLFDLLVKLGFKEIEIGFPAASQPDFDFCRQLIEENRIPEDVTVQVLTQAREDLIRRTYEALEGVRQAVVHVYNSTSTVQREQVFGLDRAGIRGIAEQGARWVQSYAGQYPQTDWSFQYSPESFTGTEPDFAVEVIDAVTAIWKPWEGQRVIINLPATVEMSMPNVFADLVETICDQIRHREHVEISLHTHNDRGCAVAAAEMGVLAGADRIEGTLMGNGERTGNMDIITMAMNLYSQGIDPQLDLSDISEIIAVTESCTEIATHPRHPYAGELVFTAFSGSHQDAIRKCLTRRQAGSPWEVAYLPIDPSDLGRRYEELVRINSQSGKGGVAFVLEQTLGARLPRWLQIELSQVVQQEAEKSGGEINSSQLHELFRSRFMEAPEPWHLRSYDIQRSDTRVNAFVSLASGDNYAGEGHGVIEALIASLETQHQCAIRVEHYDEFAVDGGTDAKALCCVRLTVNGVAFSAVAQAEDTTSAAIQAVLNATARSLARVSDTPEASEALA